MAPDGERAGSASLQITRAACNFSVGEIKIWEHNCCETQGMLKKKKKGRKQARKRERKRKNEKFSEVIERNSAVGNRHSEIVYQLTSGAGERLERV